MFFVFSDNDVVGLTDKLSDSTASQNQQLSVMADKPQGEVEVRSMVTESAEANKLSNSQPVIEANAQGDAQRLDPQSSSGEIYELTTNKVTSNPSSASQMALSEGQSHSPNSKLDPRQVMDKIIDARWTEDLAFSDLPSLRHLSPSLLSYDSRVKDIDLLKRGAVDGTPLKRNKYSLIFSIVNGRHMYTGQSGSQNINGIDVALEDGSYWRAGLELGMTYQPDRQIKVGISGTRHTFRSHYELMVNYSGSNEIQDGEGNWHSGYNHSLPTLFGDSPMKHVLIRGEDDDLQAGEAIPFALFLDHEVEEISLTFKHQWRVPFRKIEITLGATGQVGYWFAASKIASVNLYSHHDKVWHNHTTFEIDDYKISQPFNIGLGADIGLQYSLSDRHALGVRAGLSQTILGPRLYGDVVWEPTLVEGGLSYIMRF